MPQKPEDRDYKEEYRRYGGTPEQIKNRSKRVMARRAMVKKHGKKALEGKEVNHKRHLINGGTNDLSNLEISTRKKNRGFKRDRNNKPIGR